MKQATTKPPEAEFLPAGQSQALTKAEPQATTEAERMFSMIERMATDPQVDPAKLREILAVKQSWEADEARKAFARDMAVFQTECPIISKLDSANGKMYAKIDRIHRETRELRKKCGFWFTWSVCEITGNVASMAGLLGHCGGHTVPLKQVIPLPEEIVSGSGKLAQNSAQRAGSAMTYAKRYGECLALDIVTGEDNDGNNPKPKQPGPQTKTPDADVRALVVELWGVLKPVRGAKQDWDASNVWLLQEGILDGAAEPPMRAPHLDAATLRAVIAKAKAKISPAA